MCVAGTWNVMDDAGVQERSKDNGDTDAILRQFCNGASYTYMALYSLSQPP